MKMSIVMGPTWIMEVVQLIIQEHTATDFVMAGLWSVPFHIINGLQVYPSLVELESTHSHTPFSIHWYF